MTSPSREPSALASSSLALVASPLLAQAPAEEETFSEAIEVAWSTWTSS